MVGRTDRQILDSFIVSTGHTMQHAVSVKHTDLERDVRSEVDIQQFVEI